jgi:hypothetical protein
LFSSSKRLRLHHERPKSQFLFFFCYILFLSLFRPISPSSQSSLGLLRAKSSADLVRCASLCSRGEQFAASLSHVVLLLHGSQLLVLGKGQRKGNTEEQRRGGDDPGTLASKGQDAPGGAGDGVDAAGDPASGGGGDDVAESV